MRTNLATIVLLALTACLRAAEPPATAPSSKVSADAQAELSKIGEAYSKLKALDLSGTVKGEFDVDGQKKEEKLEFTSSFAAPNQFRHSLGEGALLGSTGEKFFVYLKDRNIYRTTDAPKARVRAQELPSPFGELLGSQNLSLVLALSSSPLDELTSFYGKIDKAADVTIDDRKYTALSMGDKESGVMNTTLVIDPSTHLIRRTLVDMSKEFIEQGAKEVKKAQMTIDYAAANVDVAAKAEQFAWSPPAGAKNADEAAAEEDSAAHKLVGKPAPDFKLKGLDDKEIALADLKGSVVVLDFWATWCGPCVRSLPKIEELHKEKKAAGLKVFAVNVGEEKDAVKSFWEEKKFTMPALLDSDSKVGQAYFAEAIPQTVVIGKDGKVAKVFVGAGPDTEAKLKEAVDTALKAGK